MSTIDVDTEKELVEVKIKYNNGEEKYIKKGLVLDLEDETKQEDMVNLTYHCLNVKYEDFKAFILSAVELGLKLNMFGGNDNDSKSV